MERQYLTFTLAEDAYGLDIASVRGIQGATPVTPLPNAAPWVRGVMNLRGAIVPVHDMRLRCGHLSREPDRFTVFVVASARGKTVALQVDAVHEVRTIPAEEIRPAPEPVESAAVMGIVPSGDRAILLLDLDGLLAGSGVPDGVPAGEAA